MRARTALHRADGDLFIPQRPALGRARAALLKVHACPLVNAARYEDTGDEHDITEGVYRREEEQQLRILLGTAVTLAHVACAFDTWLTRRKGALRQRHAASGHRHVGAVPHLVPPLHTARHRKVTTRVSAETLLGKLYAARERKEHTVVNAATKQNIA